MFMIILIGNDIVEELQVTELGLHKITEET